MVVIPAARPDGELALEDLNDALSSIHREGLGARHTKALSPGELGLNQLWTPRVVLRCRASCVSKIVVREQWG